MSFISALDLDKGRLNVDIKKGEKVCDIVTITDKEYTGKISLRDIWPEEGEENSGFSKYTLTSEYYGIEIEYNNKILDFNKQSEVQICLKGNEIGNFRGALIFTPEPGEEVVNIVIEKGVWLFVNVAEQKPLSFQQTTSTNEGSGGGSSGGGSTSLIDSGNETNTESISESETTKKEGLDDENLKAGITGSIIGENKFKENWKTIGLCLIIICTAGFIFNYKRKKKI